MRKRWLVILLALVMIVGLLAGCGNNAQQPGGGGGGGGGGAAQPPAGGGGGGSGELVERGYQSDMQKDVINIRAVRPLTGGGAIFEQTAFGPHYKMWEDLINQDGGLYVKSLDRKVPVKITVTNDDSDMEKTTQLFEQILANEKPDLILGPEGTARLFATASIVQRYGYFMVGAEGGAKMLETMFEDMKADYGQIGVFSVLSYSETQAPALIKLLQDLKVESVYCAYINDLHGIEYWGYTEELLKKTNIAIKGSEPVDENDVKPDVVVNNAMNSGAQAFLGFVYPGQGIPITMTAKALGYTPDLYLLGPGLCYDFFSVFAFGDYTQDSLHGIMGWGAWNEKSNDTVKKYSEDFRAYWRDKGMFWRNEDGSPGADPGVAVFQDWWGHVCYMSAMQIVQQAVENAGELDANGTLVQSTLIEYTANNTFNTVMNPQLKFTNNILMDDMYLGNVGQWQNGVFEVIDADSRRTADPIFPFPGWWQG